ncbi:hypothetical protein EJB05_02595, partial [Eragrostis curvula]
MELAELAGHRAGDDLSSVATEAAVKAMKHPRADAMMALMDCVTPELEAELCDILPAKGQELSCEAIDHISRLLSSKVILPAGIIVSPPAAITMHQEALAQIALERRAFRKKQRFIMEWIEFLLDENYEVHTITAVERMDLRHKQKIYHVNFLATRKDASDGNQVSRVLFFAQIVRGVSNRAIMELMGNNSCERDWKRSFCCPVTISAFLGRCFPCELRAAKIVHPIGIGFEYYGRQEKTYVDFVNYISTSTHTVENYHLDSDYVYFDSKLAMYLNHRAKEKEEMTEEEAYQAFLNEIPCGYI